MEKTISIVDENGRNVKLDVIDELKVESKEYMIVSSKGSDQAHAYRAERKENEIEYTSIGAGREFSKVLEAYNQKHKDEE